MSITISRREISTDNAVVMEIGERYFAFPRQRSPFQTSAGINPDEYALVQEGVIPNYQADLAISMNQGFGGFKHIDAHREVFKKGFKVPTASIFLPHYFNVNEALENRSVLYDASGNIIEGERLEKYANTLNYDCWSKLNAMFPEEQEKGTGFLGLDLAVIIGFDSENNPVFSRAPLEDCLDENCWAEVESANSQGLLTKKSEVERYIPGKVIRFWHPIKDAVVRFRAGSGRAVLGCLRYPDVSYSSLGVFSCAEGARLGE